MAEQLSWYTKTIPEVLEALRSREQGLTKKEAPSDWPQKLAKSPKKSPPLTLKSH